MELKTYQVDTLKELGTYLRACSSQGAKIAFISQTERPYREIRELPGIPYVCLRIPTGGGKTLVACHAVNVAAQEFLHTEKPLVLWLVPTNAIREQTLKALRSRNHSYRQSLETLGPATPLDLKEALVLTRSTLDTGITIIVSTLQAFRVDDTEGRKVYETNGALQSLFSGVPSEKVDPESIREDGSYPYSLSNLLRVRRPIVIVDEAHNARTDLSFETLARFQPSCIIEFTATPAQEGHPSNVLYQATAAELKAADMIKMPIRLWTQRDWKDVLASAISKRKELEEGAKSSPSDKHIRPILLIQAQASSKHHATLDADVIQDTLIKDFCISKDQCPIATGDKDELGDTDLFDPYCPVRFIITKQQLREGWDCSYAYVLCSVSEVRSPTAIEQILGRIMRLPSAEKRQVKALNAAYAYVASSHFGEVAAALENGLVENGYERFEAKRMIEQGEQATIEDLGEGTLFRGDQTSTSTERESISVPVIAVGNGDFFEPLDDTDLMETDWAFTDADSKLSQAEFADSAPSVEFGEIDIGESGRLEIRTISELQEQVSNFDDNRDWSEADLILWLDRTVRHVEFTQYEFQTFLARAIGHLITTRGLHVARLVGDKYRLREAIVRRLSQVRKAIKSRQLQSLLLPNDQRQIAVLPTICFTFDKDIYPCHDPYHDSYKFRNHYYPRISRLKSEGEEFQCAQYLDNLPEVKYWIRNVVDPKYGFWLPTIAGRFYPDFVCVLKDGRFLVAEHKGLHLWNDAEAKRKAGELWEKESNGLCLFVMTKGTTLDFGEIAAKVKEGLVGVTTGGQTEIR